jgi:hypothetical protein
MAAVFAFIGMLLTSLVVALLAAFQLGDFFNATEEFVLVLLVIALFAFASMAAFAVAYVTAPRVRVLNLVAILLVLIALMIVSSPALREWIADRASNPFKFAREQDMPITLEILVPAVFAVLVQWGLVRRRWLRAVGEEDMSLWPWIATAVGGLVVLNPFGLSILAAALNQSGTDWLAQFWAVVVAAGVAVLIVMAAIEYYIRGRIRRRRTADQTPAP